MEANNHPGAAKRRGRAALTLALPVAALVVAGAWAWREFEQNYEIRQGDAAEMVIDAAIGATAQPLDRATASSLGVGPQARGLVVTSLAGNGPAAQAGIRPGDVIERIGKTAVGSPGEAAAALKGVRAPVELRLNRRGHYAIVRLHIRPPPAGGEEAGRGEK
jgi:membrane-associated protease RseP (regulator of RpoE activity)